MKKIKLSRKSKLIIGSIGSVAILATIPAAVVSCGSESTNVDSSQAWQTEQVSQAYSQIQSSYVSTSSKIAALNPAAVNNYNLFEVLAEAGLTWPKTPAIDGVGFLATANPPSTTPDTSGVLTFNMQVVAGAYSLIKSPIKQVTISGFSKIPLAPFPASNSSDYATALANFKAAVTKMNNIILPTNEAGSRIFSTVPISSTNSSPKINPEITADNVLDYIQELLPFNYSNFKVTPSAPTLFQNFTGCLSVTLTFSGENVPTTDNTAKIAIMGFMPWQPSVDQINQVQDSLNNFILNAIVTNHALGIIDSIKATPKDFVSSGIKTSGSQVALTYADLTNGTSNLLGFPLPQNITSSNINITVSDNQIQNSKAFTITIQIQGATIPGITVSIIANSINSSN